MKKYQAWINELKQFFKNDIMAIKYLELIEEKLPKNSQEKVFSDFELPQDFFRQKNHYAIFTDGACRGNPGPGAWASVVQNYEGEVISESSGIEIQTTNNRMELGAVIHVLEELVHLLNEKSQETQLSIYSDSRYVVDGVKKWLPSWKKRGWKKSDNKEPENIDLWKDLDHWAQSFQKIDYFWVKGHSGHPQNERCDQLANKALDEAGF